MQPSESPNAARRRAGLDPLPSLFGIPVLESRLLHPGTTVIIGPMPQPGRLHVLPDTRTPIFDELVSEVGRPQLLREPGLLDRTVAYLALMALSVRDVAQAVVVNNA